MYLIIDIGNTRIKTALFKKDKIIDLIRFQMDEFQSMIPIISKKYNVEYTLISSVGKLSKKNKALLNKLFSCEELDHKSLIPFNNTYKSPKTLGDDRIALAAAAVTKFPEKNVLVIDAGTCITYDFVTEQKDYLGGAIAPGIQSRYKSLHDYTASLPLLDKCIPKTFVGTSTNESIHSGVVNGICREIDGVINQYKESYQKLTVVLTGGDAEFLSGQLKSSIFVRPFFLLEGLNTILKYNIK